MKQYFNKKDHEKFKEYFWIKKYPWKWDILYTKKTIKYIKYISWIPWLKMVWIWNSISMNYSTKNSDIDLFIITSPDSMWLNRILITLIFTILRVRKTSKNHAWMFCLSFFSTTNWLNFWNFALKDDIYIYFWIIYFKPILNIDNTYELFIKENKKWANFDKYIDINNDSSTLINKKRNILIKIINNTLIKIFLPKTLKHYKELWKPIWVIINNNMLKFHNNDIRENIRKEIINYPYKLKYNKNK